MRSQVFAEISASQPNHFRLYWDRFDVPTPQHLNRQSLCPEETPLSQNLLQLLLMLGILDEAMMD